MNAKIWKKGAIMEKNVHAGHRKRLRREFLDQDFSDTIPAHKYFELLLFYSIPRCDTNELAHRLLNAFGSISGVLEAPAEKLMQIDGISESSAVLIKSILPLARIYLTEKQNMPYRFTKREEIIGVFRSRYFGVTAEMASMMCFNGNGILLSYDVLEKGDVDSVGLPIRKILSIVETRKARNVVLAHNHPSGNACPSHMDKIVTMQVAQALRAAGAVLLDHVILAPDDYVSMRDDPDAALIFGSQAPNPLDG